VVHRIGYAFELRLDTPEKLLGSVAVVLKQIVIHATMLQLATWAYILWWS